MSRLTLECQASYGARMSIYPPRQAAAIEASAASRRKRKLEGMAAVLRDAGYVVIPNAVITNSSTERSGLGGPMWTTITIRTVDR